METDLYTAVQYICISVDHIEIIRDNSSFLIFYYKNNTNLSKNLKQYNLQYNLEKFNY